MTALGMRCRVRLWADVRAWPLWELPRRASLYVVAVILVYAAGTCAASAVTPIRLHDVGLFAFVLAFGIATAELTRHAGEPSGLVKDAHGIWCLPIAVLLPPLYAFLAPIPFLLFLQLRIRQGLVYRRVFSTAAVGLAVAAASLTFHAAAGRPGSWHSLGWLLLVAGAAAVRAAVNKLLIAVAIKGSDPAATIRGLTWDREVLHHELTELCVAVLVVIAVAQIPVVLVFALPFGTLLHRSVRHTQLVSLARIDGKTGLLNAAAWDREAVTQVTRAARIQAPLSLALIDIDHFKAVNDTYGHLAGDKVLQAVASTIKTMHRDYDLSGRFGGEEFVLLLPHTGCAEARGIAERLRRHVAALSVPVDDRPGSPRIQVTISIGVAALDSGHRQLTDLIAAADAALYYAKETGRNRVRLLAGGTPEGKVLHQVPED